MCQKPTTTLYGSLRNQSFEHHVQGFSDLLNTAFKNPTTKTANALKRYSTFRSAPKINRKLRNSVVLSGLKKIDLADDTTRTLGILSAAEFNKMAVALYRDREGQILHDKVYDYLTNSGSRSVPPSLHLFHRFFTWLLSVLADEISFLCQLQGEESPGTFPVAEVKNAMLHLELLQYLAWESFFFADYMGMVCPNGRGQREFSGNILDTTGPLSRNPGEQDRGGDIGTEFETGEEYVPESGLQSTHTSHPWILELRLITSNIYQLKTLLGWTPSRVLVTFSFQLIKYGRSGPLLKPWRELLHELFPISSEENDVLRALEKLTDNRDSRYNFFCRNGPPLQFRGEAHCEEVLGCLYTLARTEPAADISWVTNHLSPPIRTMLTSAGQDTALRLARGREHVQSLGYIETLLPCVRNDYLIPAARIWPAPPNAEFAVDRFTVRSSYRSSAWGPSTTSGDLPYGSQDPTP